MDSLIDYEYNVPNNGKYIYPYRLRELSAAKMKRVLIVVSILICSELLAATPAIIKNPIYAQDAIFRVAVGLFGIDDTENQDEHVFVFVTVNNVSKARIVNTTELDAADGQDGIVERVAFSWPNDIVNIGDEFRACVLVLQSLENICRKGYDSPSNQTEYVGISLHDAIID
jgi:hypothetical protein